MTDECDDPQADAPAVGMAVRCWSCGEWTPVRESGTDSVTIECSCGRSYAMPAVDAAERTYDGKRGGDSE